jgi:hypothetical protein
MKTPVNGYAALWGEFFLGDLEGNLLALIKQRGRNGRRRDRTLLRCTQRKRPANRVRGPFRYAQEDVFRRLQAAARCALMAERVRTIRLSMGFFRFERGDA